MPGAGAGFPTLLAGAGIQADHEAIGRGVEHHILINGEDLVRAVLAAALAKLCACTARCRSPLVASSASIMAPGSTRYITPSWTMGMVSLVPGPSRASTPCGAGHIRAIHLLERTEALRVVGAAVHQPIVRAGMQQHVLRYRDEILHHLSRIRSRRWLPSIRRAESYWWPLYSDYGPGRFWLACAERLRRGGK